MLSHTHVRLLVYSPPIAFSFIVSFVLSHILISSRLPSPPILSSPPLLSCLFSSLSFFSTSCLPYSHLLSSSSYSLIIQTREEPFGVHGRLAKSSLSLLWATRKGSHFVSRPLSFCLTSFSLVSFHVLLSPLVSFCLISHLVPFL